MNMISALILFVSVSAFSQNWKVIPSHPNSEFYRQLAAYHAPVIYQQVGVNPVADTVTRVDFDGDLVANNNWVNLDRFPTPAYVYYSVIESETHYFISYSFFHARDYSNICFTIQCHENDLEGTIFTVVKDGTPYGKISLIETLAHNQIITYRAPQFVSVPKSNDPRTRAALFIEKQGHGVKGWDVKKRGPASGERIVSGRSKYVYEPEPKILSNFLIYFSGEKSETPAKGAREGEYAYELLNVETEFWNRQNLTGLGSLWIKQWNYLGSRKTVINGVAGAFAGEKYTTGSANPPWVWHDDGERILKQGDWFFDPAFYLSSRIKLKEPVSVKYLYNPYWP